MTNENKNIEQIGGQMKEWISRPETKEQLEKFVIKTKKIEEEIRDTLIKIAPIIERRKEQFNEFLIKIEPGLDLLIRNFLTEMECIRRERARTEQAMRQFEKLIRGVEETQDKE